MPQGRAESPKRRYIQKEKPSTWDISRWSKLANGRTSAGKTNTLKWQRK
jgi:hypothetical protein